MHINRGIPTSNEHATYQNKYTCSTIPMQYRTTLILEFDTKLRRGRSKASQFLFVTSSSLLTFGTGNFRSRIGHQLVILTAQVSQGLFQGVATELKPDITCPLISYAKTTDDPILWIYGQSWTRSLRYDPNVSTYNHSCTIHRSSTWWLSPKNLPDFPVFAGMMLL